MSMATLERAILDELKTVSGNSKLRNKDIMEWITGKKLSQPLEEGETEYYLPSLGVTVAVKVPVKASKAAKLGREK